MKFLSIIMLFSLTFILTSCFEKPVDEMSEQNEIDQAQSTDNNSQEVVVDSDNEDSEDVRVEDEQEQDNSEDESTTEETGDDSSSVESETSLNATGSQTEEDIIEDLEPEIEELFNELLGSGE